MLGKKAARAAWKNEEKDMWIDYYEHETCRGHLLAFYNEHEYPE